MKLQALLSILFAVSVKAQTDDFAFGTDDSKYGVCTAKGEPRYKSFDGLHFAWQGTCRFNLASFCERRGGRTAVPLFEVFAQNENRNGQHAVSWTEYVEIFYSGDIIHLGKTGLVMVNGIPHALPYNSPGNSYDIVSSVGYSVFTATVIPLQVSFDHYHSVIVEVGGMFANKVCGLCGNFDGDSSNDWTKADGLPAANGEELGDSWVVQGRPRCLRRRDPFPGPIPQLPIDAEDAAVCDILTSSDGVLGELVRRTSDEDKRRNHRDCLLDGGFSKGRSVQYSVRHFAVTSNRENDNIVNVPEALARFRFRD